MCQGYGIKPDQDEEVGEQMSRLIPLIRLVRNVNGYLANPKCKQEKKVRDADHEISFANVFRPPGKCRKLRNTTFVGL